ncbi:hypothetical protein ACFWTE_28105, partial [Nocardiopsis sp. NPDC058631]
FIHVAEALYAHDDLEGAERWATVGARRFLDQGSPAAAYPPPLLGGRREPYVPPPPPHMPQSSSAVGSCDGGRMRVVVMVLLPVGVTRG